MQFYFVKFVQVPTSVNIYILFFTLHHFTCVPFSLSYSLSVKAQLILCTQVLRFHYLRSDLYLEAILNVGWISVDIWISSNILLKNDHPLLKCTEEYVEVSTLK